MRINEIRQLVGCGQYRVDAGAVADAIVRRLLGERRFPAVSLESSQAECS